PGRGGPAAGRVRSVGDHPSNLLVARFPTRSARIQSGCTTVIDRAILVERRGLVWRSSRSRCDLGHSSSPASGVSLPLAEARGQGAALIRRRPLRCTHLASLAVRGWSLGALAVVS